MLTANPILPGLSVRVVTFREFDCRMDVQLEALERKYQGLRKRPVGSCDKEPAATQPDARAGRK